MKFIGATLVSMVLVSCSQPYSPNLPSSIPTNPSEKLGCVLASISRNTSVEPHFRTYEFIFKSKDSALSKLSMLYRADYSLLSLPEDDKFYTNFDQEGYAGIIYMRNVPEGTYYADKAKFVGGAVQLEAAKNDAEPFTVQAGGCTYLGEMRVTPVVGKGLMGRITLKSAEVKIVDSWTRDYELFKKLYPELDAAKVRIAILHEQKHLGQTPSLPPKG
ncbi:MAG: hypothetical protein EOP10_06010 [Proteobacteria bacterium]|nr:MAG: hypothetical protein EOP10_06010 [Pseudomonadota bacterium]